MVRLPEDRVPGKPELSPSETPEKLANDSQLIVDSAHEAIAEFKKNYDQLLGDTSSLQAALRQLEWLGDSLHDTQCRIAESISPIIKQYQSMAIILSESLAPAQAEMGPLPFFLKEKRYADQSEYRMVWITEAPVEDYLHVKVPVARQFCRRATDITK